MLNEEEHCFLRTILTTTTDTEMPKESENSHKPKKRKKQQTPKIKLAIDDSTVSEDFQEIKTKEKGSEMRININGNYESTSSESGIISKEWPAMNNSKSSGAVHTIISNLSLPTFWKIVKPMAEMVLSNKNTVNETTVLSDLSKLLKCNCFQIWTALKECVLTKIKFCDKLADIHGGMLSVHEWLVFDMVLVHLQYYGIIDMDYSAPEDKKIYLDLFKLVKEFEIEYLEGDELAEAWAALTKSYNTKGRQATPMLLQCRWYQLKLETRNRFFKYYSIYKSKANLNEVAKYKPRPLQIAIADCYEFLLTKPFIFWKDLIKQKRVILREQFQFIALRQQAQGVDSSQSLSNTRAMQINTAVEASFDNSKNVSEPSETVLPKITNVFGNVNVPAATLSKICTLSKMHKNTNISTAESEKTSNEIVSKITNIVTLESETTSNANIPIDPVNTEVFIDLTRNDDWSVCDVISHKSITNPENKSSIYNVGNTNSNVSREQSPINRVAKKNLIITNEKSNLDVTEDISDFDTAIKSHKLSKHMTNPMPYRRINVCSQLEQPRVAIFKSHEVLGVQKNEEEIAIKQPNVTKEYNGRNSLESVQKQPNNAVKKYEGIDTLKSVKRLKLSSHLLQKPRHRTYNRMQLSNNPDFNRRLIKMPKKFSKSDRNQKFLAVLKPLTVDVSKEFETALVDGKIYLDESDDSNKQEANLSIKTPILIPEDKICEKIPHIDTDAAKSKQKPQGQIFLSQQKCCWAREKIYRLERKLQEINLPCHNCPHPICLCCCKDEYISHIVKQNHTKLTTKKESSESKKLEVDNKIKTNSSSVQSEVFIYKGKTKTNRCTQTDNENNEMVLKIGDSQCPTSNKNIPASVDMNIDIEEAINTTFIHKTTQIMLPKITAIYGSVQESSEDSSKTNVLPTQINNSNLSKEFSNPNDLMLKENSLLTNDSQNRSISYNDSETESTNIDLTKESELVKFLKKSVAPAKSDNTPSSWEDVNTVPVEVQTVMDETIKTLFTAVELDNTLHSEQKPDLKECHLRIKLSSHLLQKPTNCTYNDMKLLKNPDFNKKLRKYSKKFLKSYKNQLNLSLLKPITIDVSKEFERALVNGRMYLDTYISEDTKNRLKLFLTGKDNNMTSHSLSKKSKKYSKRTTKYKKKFKDKKSLDKTYDVFNKCCWAREKIFRHKRNTSTINDNCPCPSCLCCCRKKYAAYISKKTGNSILLANSEPKKSAIDTEIIIDKNIAYDISVNSFNTDLNEMSNSNDHNPNTLGLNSDLTEITAPHDNNPNTLGFNSDLTEITATHDNNPNTLGFNSDLTEITATHDNNPNTLGFNSDLSEITGTHDNNPNTLGFNSDLTEITSAHDNNPNTLDFNSDLTEITATHDNNPNTLVFHSDLTEITSTHDHNPNTLGFHSDLTEITATHENNLLTLDLEVTADKDDLSFPNNITNDKVAHDDRSQTTELSSNNSRSVKNNIIFMTTAQIPKDLKPSDVKLLSDKLDSKISEFVAKLTSYEFGENNNMNEKTNNIFMDWKVSTSVANYSSEYLLGKLIELPLCPKRPEPFSIKGTDDVIGNLLNKVLTPITSVSEFFYAYLLNGLFFILDVEKKSVHAINICF